MLSLYNIVGHLEGKRLVRVSTQTVRDTDYYHFHDVIQLCYVISGELRHVVNGREYIHTPGTCAFLLPYMSHLLDTKSSEDTPVIVYVWFHESFLRDAGIDFFSYTDAAHFEGKKIPEVFNFGEDAEKATALIRQIASEFNRGADMSLDIMRSSITELFRLACREKQKIKLTSVRLSRFERIQETVDYMREHFKEKLELDFLASLSGMPRRTFTTNFRNITGLSPNMFLISLRLAKAESLLGLELLHDEIAKEAGLSNHANLARAFKKYLGASPTEYLENKLLNTSVSHHKSLHERYPFLAEDE
ncbi:MAG: helix-turn-helix domain-containing protein [Ruminococcaceae bacterium]|nr:helix-turn-helix domain-containing protein [Oscillospiraceae bacterium]